MPAQINLSGKAFNKQLKWNLADSIFYEVVDRISEDNEE